MSGIILLIQNSPVITKLIWNLKFNWTHHLCDRECWLFFASRIVSSPKRLSTLCHKDYNIFDHFIFATFVYLRYQRSIAIMFKDPGKETRCLQKWRAVTTGHHINR